MKNVISKELLSEVLEVKVLGFTYIPNDKDTISSNESIFVTLKDSHPCINIHELAHKCKEWAKNKGYYLKSWINDDDSGTCEILLFGKHDAKTEYEAIFKACQWILDNKAEK